jgi:RNA polymerase sigma-70 factor (ECF subfamily)
VGRLICNASVGGSVRNDGAERSVPTLEGGRSAIGMGWTVGLPCNRHERVRALVDEHIQFVARTLRRAGVPSSDIDDEIQKTFMVVANRIDDVQVGSERGFLFGVAHNVAARRRRTLARRREILDADPPERVEAIVTPEFLADQKQTRQLCARIVGSLHVSLRAVFTMFELEEMNVNQIAEALCLRPGTVASRLRRARAQVRRRASPLAASGAHGVGPSKREAGGGDSSGRRPSRAGH